MSEADIQVIMERLNNFIEVNKEEHRNIKDVLDKISDDHEKRIKRLEDWKLVFVAKFTVYASIALFLGSLIGNVVVSYLTRKF